MQFISKRFSFSGLLLPIFLLCLSLYQEVSAQENDKSAVLQGAILVRPTSQPTQFQTEKVQPGHSVKIGILVENIGNAPSPAGKIGVRFGFAKPLENEPNSVLFQTEQLDLPSIQPGASLEIDFEETHRWPSLPDFIREDWGMREYQAVIQMEDRKEIIGSLAITFSAYYYPGIRKELPAKI